MLNFGRCRLYAASERTCSIRAVDLVENSLVIDMLGLLTLDWPRLRRWHTDPRTFSPEDFTPLRESGINVFNPAVDLNGKHPNAETREWLQQWNGFIAARNQQFTRVLRCSDIETSRSAGKIGILLGMQNSDHFRSAEDVPTFWDLGQRLSQLTYNGANRIGYGCTERVDQGLTEFGESIVSAMNTSGMIIDVSHAGERTTLDAFEASGHPVLITHSNCKALVPHPRCKSDGVIRAMAKQGGVMGITCVRSFLRRSEDATLEDALNHFDHAIRVAGLEHIGIGSDTDLQGRDGTSAAVRTRGLNHPRRIYDLTDGLLRRRYNSADIALILGGNFRRVMSRIFC